MTTITYVSRRWDDDERNVKDYISYSSAVSHSSDYVPVYKILKEMYDEDKQMLYQYENADDLSASFDDYYDPFYDMWYLDESDYYDDMSVVSSGSDIEDMIEDTNTGHKQFDKFIYH